MNAIDFVKEIEKYFGPYENEYRRGIVTIYLNDHFTEDDLDKLYKLTIEGFSSKYKTVPDVAVFRDLADKYNKARGEWYKYENGTVEYLGDGIGIHAPEKRELPGGRQQIEKKT